MEQFFKSQGITKDKTIYAYCHVGAGRSSHIITALQLLGYDNVKVYTGSWDEWGNDMNLPIRR
jgi:thiosulfate/3-mercaptopyruvate sulfurtransferase